jgi:hypothetical protein
MAFFPVWFALLLSNQDFRKAGLFAGVQTMFLFSILSFVAVQCIFFLNVVAGIIKWLMSKK